jgi:PAS domain S-box-containing protein
MASITKSGSLPIPLAAVWLVKIAACAVVYYFLARWSLLLAFEGTNASPIWPPSGVAFGALLLLGRRVWPAIAIGAFSANLAVFSANYPIGLTTLTASAAIAAGNTLEALAGYALLRRLKVLDSPLDQPQNVFRFLTAVLLMCMVAASVGTATLLLGGFAPVAALWPVWINWWLGDVGGILIVTPLMIIWLAKGGPSRQMRFRPGWSMAAALAAFTLLSWLIFDGHFSSGHHDRLLLYLHMPLIALIAYRYGQPGVSVALMLLSGIAVWHTIHETGPFATADLNSSLVLLVTFIVLCCMTGLILAADINQRTQFQTTPISFGDVKVPWLTLLAALGLTVFIWHTVSEDAEDAARDQFESLGTEVQLSIIERMTDYQQILRGGVALFTSSQQVTREEWHKYARVLEIDQRFPGMQSFAFAEWVHAADKAAHVTRIRNEGFPDYAILPAGEREAYLPVNYIEPFNWRNQRAFGYDMYSETVRKQAIAQAADTGRTTISGKVRLAQENGQDEQAGFVMYMPVYRNGMPTDTREQRQHALLGYVSSGFRMNDLIQGIVGEQSPWLRLEIFDGQLASEEAKMYDSAAPATRKLPAYTADFPLHIANHLWTLHTASLPAFEKNIDHQKAQIILIAGIIVSLLLFMLVRSLAITRESALALADDMTTALRTSELELRKLNSRLALAAEAGGIGVWEWNVQTGRLTWDARMYEIHQIAPMTASSTYSMWRDRVHPDDLAGIEGALAEALIHGSALAHEYRIVLPDDSSRRIKTNGVVVRDERGQPLHMIGINIDVSELRQTEESLRASEKRFRSIFEHAPIGIAIVSLDGRWLSVNNATCAIVGYTRVELEQMTFHQVTHPDDLQADLDHVRQLMEGSTPSYQMEKRYIRKDGQLVWVLLTVTLLRDEAGKPLYFLSQIMNISDRKQKEQAIAGALAEKEVLLKEVYHRVKNNLQVVSSLFNLQLRTLPEGEARTALRESANRVRAMALVHEKLYRSSNLSSIALDSYIEDMCRQLGTLGAVSQRDIRITTELEPIEIGLEMAVPVGLQLNELISNSLKHGFPDDRPGNLHIRLARRAPGSDTITLEVTDDGVGLPAGLNPRTSTSLGLKLVASLAAQIDGEFDIASRDDGTHASLTFRLDGPSRPEASF